MSNHNGEKTLVTSTINRVQLVVKMETLRGNVDGGVKGKEPNWLPKAYTRQEGLGLGAWVGCLSGG